MYGFKDIDGSTKSVKNTIGKKKGEKIEKKKVVKIILLALDNERSRDVNVFWGIIPSFYSSISVNQKHR